MSTVSKKIKEAKIRVPLLLAGHLADMLDNLCSYYDMDRTHCLRRLIVDDYDRIVVKMGGKLTRGESTQAGSGPHLPVVGVSGEWLLHDQPAGEEDRGRKRRKGGSK